MRDYVTDEKLKLSQKKEKFSIKKSCRNYLPINFLKMKKNVYRMLFR